MKLERRRFVKILTFGTAASIVAGKIWRRQVMAFCNVTSTDKEAVVRVKISDYPALQQDFGSVRLGINPIVILPPHNPYPDGNFWPILINRDGLGGFIVLDCECRHDSCVVDAYNSTTFRIECPCHGSVYDFFGQVINGPATEPLHQYPYEFDGETISIRMPCWGFDISLAVASNDPGSRVRLDFPTFPNVTYEVSFRERPNDPWSMATFANLPTDAANQTTVVGTGLPMSVYLDRTTPTGFYAVGMKLSEM